MFRHLPCRAIPRSRHHLESLVFQLATLRRPDRASRETLSITVTLPNEQRIEVPDAVVRWSREQEFTVENLANKPHTRARLPHYVNRLAQEPAEIIPWVTIAPYRFDSRSPLCCRSSVSLLPHGRIFNLAWMPITVGTTQQPCVSGDRLPSREIPGRSSTSVRSMRMEAWRIDDNAHRPHGSLGNLTPREFADLAAITGLQKPADFQLVTV
jgi:hypothetical protein